MGLNGRDIVRGQSSELLGAQGARRALALGHVDTRLKGPDPGSIVFDRQVPPDAGIVEVPPPRAVADDWHATGHQSFDDGVAEALAQRREDERIVARQNLEDAFVWDFALELDVNVGREVLRLMDAVLGVAAVGAGP